MTYPDPKLGSSTVKHCETHTHIYIYIFGATEELQNDPALVPKPDRSLFCRRTVLRITIIFPTRKASSGRNHGLMASHVVASIFEASAHTNKSQ